MKRRLHPLEKPFFLESSTQKWALLFILLGVGLVFAQGFGWIHDPQPYLNFILQIGSIFIAGSFGTDITRAAKCRDLPRTDNTDDQNNSIRPIH